MKIEGEGEAKGGWHFSRQHGKDQGKHRKLIIA